MAEQKKNIEVIIPHKIQIKIDEGSYKIKGTQVRDLKGRIVCNLDSLEQSDSEYFSPAIFQSFENCLFISKSIISLQLSNELKNYQSSMNEMSLKLDRILESQVNNINASITDFDSHFCSLMHKSSLTTKEICFQSGVKAASLLGSHMQSYLDDFQNTTIIFSNKHDKEQTYSQYSKEKWKPDIKLRQTSVRFSDHIVNFLAYSFLNILNNINILSVIYDKREYVDYIKNLDALEEKLSEILFFLIRPINQDDDVYSMCYSTRGYDRVYYPIDNINRILSYDKSVTMNDLIVRNYPHDSCFPYDDNRLRSIMDILDILDDISNLRCRSEQMAEINIADLNEIEDAKSALLTYYSK
ncbi:hypothetical protein B9T13_10080 [Wohlfahrtiimonas chitiniclastica]|uniref:hypothetical protein n=1 Tax=Wohlfahrtiimonas chitiniclastica TaxID=400946 RepID=UPI000B98D12F|nr:hypothetical protein [Wohlfahrtiimonas chitiniclastica]OYQ69137.1 hypothetical protein B9T13_10080 [Wohlfahrtiimonas chitiniclastica]